MNNGTMLGIDFSLWEQTEAKEQKFGFELPPEGEGILWEIYGHKLGQTKNAQDPHEFLLIQVKMTTEEGEERRSSIYFDQDDVKHLKNLKYFFVQIGREDWNPRDNTLEELHGTLFHADFKHYNKRTKNPDGTPEIGGQIVLGSIYLPEDDVDEKPLLKDAARKTRPEPRKAASRTARRRDDDDDEYEDAYEDAEDGEEFEEEPEPIRMRRRRVKMAASDKD